MSSIDEANVPGILKQAFKDNEVAIRKDEREKILKAVTELFCIQKDSEAWRWLDTLRKQEQPK